MLTDFINSVPLPKRRLLSGLTRFDSKVSLALIGLDVLPTALAHTLYFSSLSSLKSFETATLALLDPITATLFGVFIFAEILHLPFVLGAVFALGGIVSVAAGK